MLEGFLHPGPDVYRVRRVLSALTLFWSSVAYYVLTSYCSVVPKSYEPLTRNCALVASFQDDFPEPFSNMILKIFQKEGKLADETLH